MYNSGELNDDAKLLQEAHEQGCRAFSVDHYCKQLTACAHFHEGIDCVRFFTTRCCPDNRHCKFKHRIIHPSSSSSSSSAPSFSSVASSSLAERDRERDRERERERYEGGGKYANRDPERFSHNDLSMRRDDYHNRGDKHSKSKMVDDKKRSYQHNYAESDSHSSSKRTKRIEDSSHSKPDIVYKEEKLDGRKVERRPSGGVEISLPPNWKAAWSKQGEIYYYNTVTGERTWNLPESKSKEHTYGTKDTKDKHHKDSRKASNHTSKSSKNKDKNEENNVVQKERQISDNQTERTISLESKTGDLESNLKENIMEDTSASVEPQQSTQSEIENNSPPQEDENLERGVDELIEDMETNETPTMKPRIPRPNVVRVLQHTPILTNLLSPPLADLICKYTKSQQLPQPTPALQPPPPSSQQQQGTSSEGCVQCSHHPLLPNFTEALGSCLRFICCNRCTTLLADEALKTQMVQLHWTPSMYNSRKASTTDSIQDTRNTLLTLYKQHKSK